MHVTSGHKRCGYTASLIVSSDDHRYFMVSSANGDLSSVGNLLGEFKSIIIGRLF